MEPRAHGPPTETDAHTGPVQHQGDPSAGSLLRSEPADLSMPPGPGAPGRDRRGWRAPRTCPSSGHAGVTNLKPQQPDQALKGCWRCPEPIRATHFLSRHDTLKCSVATVTTVVAAYGLRSATS